MKRGILALGLIFAAQSLLAQDWAKARLNNSTRHREWVEFKSGDRKIKAFIVYPERKDKAPVVLVIHEIFGLSDWVRGLCDQLAENGVIAIAPDLLSGQTFSDPERAMKAISFLPEPQIKADLDATSDYALKIPAGNGTLADVDFAGGRLGLPIRQYESETESGLLVLRNRAEWGSKGRKHCLFRLRLLRRERCARQRDHSESAGIDEACRKKIRAGGLRRRRTWIHAGRREARC